MTTYPVRGTPLTHQMRALNEAGLKTGHSFFMDPGAGKTFTTIAEAGLLYLQGKIDGMLISAPNGPHLQWVDEQFPEWAAYPWHGITNRMSPTVLQKALRTGSMLDAMGVGVINHDALRTPNGKKFVRDFRAVYPRTYLAFDESQKVKDHRAARTKEAMSIAAGSTYSRILSGTPILKGIEDLWTQYEISCPRQAITGFSNYWAFKGYYCITEKVWGRNVDPRATKIVGYQNEDELMRRTRPYVTRVMSDEFMQGEKPTFIKVSCPMEKEQASVYKQMEKLLLAQIDGGVISVRNALSQLQKLQQIASGFIYLDDTFEEAPEDPDDGWGDLMTYKTLGRNKIDAALDLIDMLDEPVIVWAPFKALQHMIVTELQDVIERRKMRYRPIYSYAGRDTIIDWKKHDDGILIANQAGGAGVGQNLQICAANIYLTNIFAAEARWQSLKRTDRIGQKRPVRVWDLMAPGTPDLKVMHSLMNKEDISKKNIDGLRSLII